MTQTASRAPMPSPVHVFCNGVPQSASKTRKCEKISLEYRSGQETKQNIKLLLPEFIQGVYHLPERIQDLLEIAAYVFCADRNITRGKREALEYHSWSREFQFFIRVRDAEFWNTRNVQEQLQDALIWMTGDRNYSFKFLPGHKTNPADMFDNPEHSLAETGEPRIVLFSGGLDSLAGVVDLLESNEDSIWPISHDSANSCTVNTQKMLIQALHRRYKGRINYRVLKCHQHSERAPEESQRTRAFLYCCMAFAMSVALEQPCFYVYENGVTALNFAKRTDMINARASRTAHPKTLRLLQNLFSLIGEKEFEIKSPFAFKTKTDILVLLEKRKRVDLLNSSVSCSKTFKELGRATHCGTCSQCIDRRFAAFASECDSTDDASGYAFDFINDSIPDGETKTGIMDYLRQARKFLYSNIGNFQAELGAELADAIDEDKDEVEQIEAMHSLCKRHGEQVQKAAARMTVPLRSYPEGSLKTILWNTDFTRPPVYLLASQIAKEIEEFIRHAFVVEKPINEDDFNHKIDGFLTGHRERFQREHPCLSFATARVIPDHSNEAHDLLIESKYIRGTTSPSKVTAGISEDLTKYPEGSLRLFLVYDPDGKIADRETFKRDFERKPNCIVYII
ncbi:MAG: 7-cyano-7-deazaguanine synthase [Candidatus Sumerlaeota bacterium]|nr:7-cyano-7-deazaguanine synthase [Candidatus Sumerlaeota bacterium]